MILTTAQKLVAGKPLFLKMMLALLLGLISCKEKKETRQIERSFYYWKSVLNITHAEEQKLDSLKVKIIYLKFFDVDWDANYKTPMPVAKLLVTNYKLADSIQVIPTVFITNGCIQNIDSPDVKILATQIFELLKSQIGTFGFNKITELQIDCDWTASTKEKYFVLLNHLKSLIPGKKLSATIRLHQIKYLTKTGVPPVDRGLLMCYNMGNLKDPATKNSILEVAELKKYIGNLSNYPLPLDVALPLFDWQVLYHNNTYAGLMQGLPAGAFNNACFAKSSNRYQVLKDTLLQGYDLRKGDMIRNEQSDIKEIIAAAEEIGRHLKNTPLRVSLYHLDSVILNKYSTHELESIYNSLH